MREGKVREIAVVDHLKCGEPVWRGARYVCPKHPRVQVAKLREGAGAKPKPQPKPPERDAQRLPEPGNMPAVLDALLQRLRHSLLTEVEDLAAVGHGINKRLDAIEEKLEGILTEPDPMEVEAKLEEIRAEMARINLGVDLAPVGDEPPAEAPAEPPAKPDSKW